MDKINEKTVHVTFMQWDCIIVTGQYGGNGRLALQLVDAHDFEPVAVASVNLANHSLSEGEIFIKNYSENEGMVECLVEAGLIAEPHNMVQSGFVYIPVCKLNTDQFNFEGPLVERL